MDGHTFDDALADLRPGGSSTSTCGTPPSAARASADPGAYGHTMAVAPEQDGDEWLVADPWCSPPVDVVGGSLLRAGAEKLGTQAYSAATAGPRGVRNQRELIERMRPAMRVLMTLYRPDAPAVVDPPETEGFTVPPSLHDDGGAGQSGGR